ncbi:hypothetical protein CAEBREN_19360 [Caenorhabditis brenneri]|uniref:non-specific serine/threonine protein kinase n=1 Tax=Caenorhabditis brenneri TaxID=135651 RepID=G0P938_CAEBE|nr:hypothetical protein CAEBREN_19360 [Caenorhabditis brenneri]
MAEFDTVKSYRFIEELGSGAFGQVFRVEDLRDNKICALKVVEEVKDGIEDVSGKQEVRFLKALKGVAGIPDLLDSFSMEKKLCIITPLLLSDLGHFLRHNPNRRFTPKTVARIGNDLITILKSVHSHGIVHRDIKPDNLLLGETLQNARLFLSDFGMAFRYSTAGGVKIRAPRLSYSFEQPVHTTPVMMVENKATPLDDVVMSLYTLVFISGLFPFNEPTWTGRYFQKSDFMDSPETILVGENSWLVPFAEKVCGYEKEEIVDYEELCVLLTNSFDAPIDTNSPYELTPLNGRFVLY